MSVGTINFSPALPPFDSLALYGYAYPQPSRYIERGLELSTNAFSFIRHSFGVPTDPALFNNSGIATVYLRSVSAAPFGIQSMDLDGYGEGGSASSVTFHFVATTGGGQTLTTSFTTNASLGLETFTFPAGFVQLTELRWTVTGQSNWGIFDNLVVDSAEAHNYAGTVEADVIVGSGGDDIFILNNGDPFYEGSADIVRGGGGDDLFYFGSAFHLDAVDGGDGADRLLLQGDYSQVHALSIVGVETVLLLAGSDTSYGDVAGNHYSYSLHAQDHVVGANQQVRIDGSQLRSGESFTFNGTAEKDGGFDLIGGGGDDALQAGDGNDRLEAGAGADMLTGGKGNDIYVVDGLDTVVENAGQGSDTVYASQSFTLAAGVEVEIFSVNDGAATVAINLTGNEFGQALFGNAGNNFLIAGGGADALYGGLGNDTYSVDTLDVVFDAGGNDIIYSSTNYQLNAGVQIETLAANDFALTTPLNLAGNEYDQSIFGNAGDNFIIGGGGADGLYGGLGNDTYSVDSLDAVLDAGGFDIVYSSTNYSLTEGFAIEILSASDFASTAPIFLQGNEFDQQIFGNAGDNVLIAGAGADGLYGKGGNDTYSIDSRDVVVENAGEGYDTIYTSTSFILGAGTEIEVISANDFAATSAINLTGNAGQQQIFGNAGANMLDGGGGADALIGSGGADTFAFTTALGAANVDSILDFGIGGADRIALDHGIFGLGIGTLAASAFVSGSAAGDADDRIVYNQATGQLFFDADGSGAGAAILFATLTGAPVITAGDFVVI